MSSHAVLDNIFWHTLSGPHSKYSEGTDDARRYARGFSPIVAFADLQRPNFAALAAFCQPGEPFYIGDWNGPTPPGWRIDAESTMYRMVWEGEKPADDESLAAVPLGKSHARQAQDLALLTRPGPFGERTIELGDYFGRFDGDRLVAMAGERMFAGGLREISAICTHPDHQGHGFARRLTAKLVRRVLQRGETPFLHVMRNNATALGLYQRLGFRIHAEPVVRVVSMT